jgi:hypothetical protein
VEKRRQGGGERTGDEIGRVDGEDTVPHPFGVAFELFGNGPLSFLTLCPNLDGLIGGGSRHQPVNRQNGIERSESASHFELGLKVTLRR